MKRKNNFTDALGKELSARKLFDKKIPQPEEEIFLSEDTLPDFTVELLENQPAKKKSKVNLKKSKTKRKKKKIADANFEKRVFAEADNDFFDEKQPEHIGNTFRSVIKEKKSQTSAFRSKVLSEDTKKLSEEKSPNFDPELYRKLTRAELAGVGLSIAAMLYSFMNLDKPLFFLALSLFIHLMRPLIGGLCGKHNRSVQNAMRSFSWVLFAGAILFLFMLSF